MLSLLFTSSRSFYPPPHPAHRWFLHLREIQVMWSQTTTELMHGNAVRVQRRHAVILLPRGVSFCGHLAPYSELFPSALWFCFPFIFHAEYFFFCCCFIYLFFFFLCCFSRFFSFSSFFFFLCLSFSLSMYLGCWRVCVVCYPVRWHRIALSSLLTLQCMISAGATHAVSILPAGHRSLVDVRCWPVMSFSCT